MMNNKNQVKNAIKKRLSRYNEREQLLPATLGYAGETTVPGMDSWCYARLSSGEVIPVYNQVTAARYDLAVWVRQGAHGWEVTGARRLGETTAIDLRRHGSSHGWLAGDSVWIHKRQILPLRLEAVGTLMVRIRPDVVYVGGAWREVGGDTVSLAQYLPGVADTERFVLITIGTAGTGTVTAGSTQAFGDLTAADIPAVPAGHIPVGVVRLYFDQDSIVETIDATDLIDLRWSGSLSSAGEQLPLTAVDANTVYAGPVSGADAIPGFRALVDADIPAGIARENLPFVTIGNQAGLSAERALSAGALMTLTDGGANGAATLAVDDTKLVHTSGKLNIAVTAAKILSLASSGDFTFTVPATGTAALLGVTNAFTGLNTFTSTLSDSSSNQITSTFTQTTSANGTRTPKNLLLVGKPIVNTGVTDSGSFIGQNGLVLRNYVAAGTDDGGTLDVLTALYYQIGHNNTNSGISPVTNTVRGIWLHPYGRTGTIGLLQCVYVGDLATGGTVTAGWGLYILASGYPNFLKGKLLLGDTVDDGQMLQVTQVDSATNTVGEVARISRQTSGTAAAGFGARLLWQLESSTTTNQDAAAIDAVLTTATHATRTTDIVFSAVNAGTFGEVWRMKASGDLLGIKGGVTAEGGYGFWSVADETISRGHVLYVEQGGTVGRVKKNPTDGGFPVGVAYADATAGNPVFVVTKGRALVLPDAAVTATLGYAAFSSSTAAGLVQQSSTVPAVLNTWVCVWETNGSGNGVITAAILKI